jgi:uncharacterized tellurite resistance protein B-like protein
MNVHQSPPSIRDVGEPSIEAIVELMFLTAFADGDFGEEERVHFHQSIESLTDGRVGGDTLGRLIARIEREVEREVEREGRAARLASINERLADEGTRKAALCLAIQLAAADGIIRTSERELIFEAAEALEIDRDEAADLVRSLTP